MFLYYIKSLIAFVIKFIHLYFWGNKKSVAFLSRRKRDASQPHKRPTGISFIKGFITQILLEISLELFSYEGTKS
jgi:hypothetical protein